MGKPENTPLADCKSLIWLCVIQIQVKILLFIDKRGKIDQLLRKPSDTHITLWAVILDHKPSHLTMDEWIEFNSNDGKHIFIQFNCVHLCLILSFWTEKFTNIDLNAESVAQEQNSGIEIITLDSDDESERKFNSIELVYKNIYVLFWNF